MQSSAHCTPEQDSPQSWLPQYMAQWFPTQSDPQAVPVQ
jgi:hypothetical protein